MPADNQTTEPDETIQAAERAGWAAYHADKPMVPPQDLPANLSTAWNRGWRFALMGKQRP